MEARKIKQGLIWGCDSEHAELAALESLSLDGMLDQLNKHLNK